jgi:integrase
MRDRLLAKLTALSVKNAKPGRHADGLGLYLRVKPSGARSWLLRVQVSGRRRDIGLGSITDLTLTEARERAAQLRKAARAGRDPIAERDKDRRPLPTFKEAAKACHAEMKRGWTSKNAISFLSSLEAHVFPVIGNMRIDHVEASHIRDALAPIWIDIPEMARKVRIRINMVLNYAKGQNWRPAEAPSRSVSLLLGKQRSGGNFPAMPYAEVPAFVTKLRDETETVGRLALLFVIFTGARSGEVRSARWSHIDTKQKLWNRPAELMKTRLAHSVTLSEGALVILERAAARRTTKEDCLIFSNGSGGAISDMTISKVMRDMKVSYVPHGFRSSLTDWAAEKMPTIPEAVAEAALAHLVPDKVQRAYRRTAFLDLRRQLLDTWGSYVDGNRTLLSSRP